MQSARTSDEASTRMLLDAYLPEISRLRMLYPGLVDGELARYGLSTRARALDLCLSRQEREPFALFVTSIIEQVDRDLDLVRWSLTTPKGKDDRATVLAAGRELLARVNADGGDRAGGLLARDRRDVDDDAGHHLYGFTAAKREDRAAILNAWISITGATRRSIDVRSVGLWEQYAKTGDDRGITSHLTKCVEYGLHDLPRGEVRDLEQDVMATGVLAAPWRAFQAAGAPLGRPSLPSPLSRQAPIRVAVTGKCAICGVSLGERRVDAKTCRDRCRKRLERQLAKEAPQPSQATTQGFRQGRGDPPRVDMCRDPSSDE